MVVVENRSRKASLDAPIAFHVPHRAPGELSSLARVLEGRGPAEGGTFAEACEALLIARLDVPVHLTHSATAALEVAAMALDLGPGDEVVVPSFTFCATATAFRRAGARIVLCDVDPHTLMAGPREVAKAMSARTKAVVAVHYGGAVADLAGLAALCERHGAVLVEDAAQALGSSRGGIAAGTRGRFAAFSFHRTKVAQCGTGGALVVRDGRDRRTVQRILDRGTDASEALPRGRPYRWVRDGSSFRPSELQAAQLEAQLRDLDRNLALRRRLATHYRRLFAAHGARLPVAPVDLPPGCEGNDHLFATLAPSAGEAERLRAAVAGRGIACPFHYVPLHVSPMGRRMGYAPSDLPVSANVWQRVVRLPLHTAMDENDVERVVAALLAVARSPQRPRMRAPSMAPVLPITARSERRERSLS